MAPVTIDNIQVITTQPAGSRLVIVKVNTSEPGLYGLGCATFTQRWRAFVAALEAWVIDALGAFNVEGGPREGRVGVWVERKGPGWSREDKIAAIGVKLRRWVSFHGVSLNVEPDLTHFDGIVPCGQTAHGVTSLVDLGLPVSMDEADAALKAAFTRVFGPVEDAEAPA